MTVQFLAHKVGQKVAKNDYENFEHTLARARTDESRAWSNMVSTAAVLRIDASRFHDNDDESATHRALVVLADATGVGFAGMGDGAPRDLQ
jgi:hypothetical protein